MDSPFIAGLMVLGAIFAIGVLIENWSWSKPLFAIGAVVLIIETILLAVR